MLDKEGSGDLLEKPGKAALVGLMAGEGCFTIGPSNGGQSWRCAFGLNLRDDDSELVLQLADAVACGRVYSVPACRTSKPQLAWQVARMADCRRLGQWLDGYPLLTKKAQELAIWREAVEAWHESGSSERAIVMDSLSARLSSSRSPRPSTDCTQVDITPQYLEAFFSGFASAEGHFGATEAGHPRFVINLHADDEPVLALFQERFEIGLLQPRRPHRTSGPSVSWRVSTLQEVPRLVEVLERHPPIGKAYRVYAAWRDLVSFVLDHRGRTSPAIRDRRRSLAKAVGEARQYRPPPPLPEVNTKEERRLRLLRVLQEWAGLAQPPYTCTAYEAERHSAHPDWPQRVTIVRAFGSWHSAVLAAGLPTDGLRARDTIERALAGSAASRAVRREAGRRRVAEAILACRRELGADITASEFFRWRLRIAPESPSQGTLYVLFPGGWAEALSFALAQVNAGIGSRSRPLAA
jgi:hypothetical protein